MAVDKNNWLRELLFDDDYADLFFKWQDGTKIPAHKIIVFKKAAYFKSGYES